jgi:hypothetical protein
VLENCLLENCLLENCLLENCLLEKCLLEKCLLKAAIILYVFDQTIIFSPCHTKLRSRSHESFRCF